MVKTAALLFRDSVSVVRVPCLLSLIVCPAAPPGSSRLGVFASFVQSGEVVRLRFCSGK